MRPSNGFVLRASLSLLLFVASDVPVIAQVADLQLRQEVVVTTPARIHGGSVRDALFVFGVPVQIPGTVLNPGSYVFRRPEGNVGNVVQVLSGDRRRIYAMFFAMPVLGPHETVKARPEAVLGVPRGPGQPRWLKRWTLASTYASYEPLYPTKVGVGVNPTAD